MTKKDDRGALTGGAKEIAGDARSEAQWIGDIGHRTLERLEAVRGELSNLARQFELLSKWCDTQGQASAAYMLNQYKDEALELAMPNAAAMLVQTVTESTGREKQSYHNHS